MKRLAWPGVVTMAIVLLGVSVSSAHAGPEGDQYGPFFQYRMQRWSPEWESERNAEMDRYMQFWKAEHPCAGWQEVSDEEGAESARLNRWLDESPIIDESPAGRCRDRAAEYRPEYRSEYSPQCGPEYQAPRPLGWRDVLIGILIGAAVCQPR